MTDSRPPQPTVTLIVLSGLPGVGKTTIAPDLDEHKRRVESRVPDIAHHKVPTWPEVMAHDYRPWDTERLVIDTARLTVPKSIPDDSLRIGLDPHVASGRRLMS